MNDRKNRNHLGRGKDSVPLSEMVERRESRARLTDDLQEGKLNMLFNRDDNTGPVMRAGRIFLAGFLSVLLAGSTVAQNSRNVPDVTAMSMEDLMNLQVTSVSKRTQKVADAAAAIFVITQEDIRRSGATSIPEALRLVPGLEVARIDQNKWAIGSRPYYRAYTKYFEWGSSAYPSGMTAHDGWDALRGGFRADWTPAGANSLTLQGDIYRTRFDETLTVASLSAPYSNTFPNDGKYSGGNILGRWHHTSEGSSMSF